MKNSSNVQTEFDESGCWQELIAGERISLERGREFIFEGKRRTDLIRFGKFTTGAWWDHEPTGDPTRTIFPIPGIQINSNPNLVQNPGY